VRNHGSTFHDAPGTVGGMRTRLGPTAAKGDPVPRAAIEGESERPIVPEGNLLDVNRAEPERAFPTPPMFTNFGALLASLAPGAGAADT